MVLSLLTSEKSFTNPWVGSERLNQIGLHKARMRLAAFNATLRKSQVFYRTGQWRKQFARDGFIMVENFLPENDFFRLQKEVSNAADQARQRTPSENSLTRGFGAPKAREWGIDRFDGGTLNRFIHTDRATMPETLAFSKNRKLQSLCRTIVGLPLRTSNVRIYELVHGNDEVNHDLQKDFHRDTFFSSMKFWYFINPVGIDDGPFIYVPGSHKLTPERLDWEHKQALHASKDAPNEIKGGSFRISPSALKAMNLPAPVTLTAKANTLVMADTLGFHRRGDARPGTSRLSIYSSNRPYPFSPFGI